MGGRFGRCDVERGYSSSGGLWGRMFLCLVAVAWVHAVGCGKACCRERGAGMTGKPATRVVDIHVEDHSGVKRSSWPVTGGVPLVRGMVSDASKVGLAGTDCQTRVLSRWGDGSIRWLLLDYQADLDAGGRAEHRVVVSEEPISTPEGNSVSESADEIIVDTGAMKFSVSKRRFEFVREAWVDLDGNGGYGEGERVVKPGGQDHFFDLQANDPERPAFRYTARDLLKKTSRGIAADEPMVEGGPLWMRPEGGGDETRYSAVDGEYSARVAEHGPMRTVVEMKGTIGANAYTIWVHAYRGKPFLRVQHNFLFRGDCQKDNIRRIGLTLPVDLGAGVTFSAAGLEEAVAPTDNAYLHCTGPADVFNLEHKGFGLDWHVQAGRHVRRSGREKTGGWIDATGGKLGVTMSIKDMAYMYPKELSCDPLSGKLTAWLWGDHGGQVMDMRASGWPDGMQGVSFTHDIFYNFHAAGDEAASAGVAAAFDDPLQPYADPDWYGYRGTKAAGMIMPYGEASNEQFPASEAVLATRTAFIYRSMTDYCWLGMLNYGDLFWAYKYNEKGPRLGTWGISSRQDNYDGWRRGNSMMTYKMMMQYLRSGNHDYWRAAEAHAKYVRDKLVKHYNSENPVWVGIGRRHASYWGVATHEDAPGGVSMEGYGTNWLGHWLHWNLTGDWQTYDVLDDIRFGWKQSRETKVEYMAGAAYIGLKLLGSIPGYEKAGEEADGFFDLAEYYLGGSKERSREWRDCTWFYAYGIYLQDVRDEKVIKALMDWMKINRAQRDHWGMYWYRDNVSTLYWAGEGDEDLQKAAYEELLRNGISDTEIVDAQVQAIRREIPLYEKYGLEGLFECDFGELARAVAPYSWRAKDDIMQQQWDEPLSMAVIDDWRRKHGK